MNKERQDLTERILQIQKLWSVKKSSTGPSTGYPYNSVTVLGAAGGVSVGPLTVPTVTVRSSGTAGNATSSIPPEWMVVKHPTDPYNYKAHLVDPDEVFPRALCGKGRHLIPVSQKPHPARMCKTCLRAFEKNVLEGRYAR